MKMHSLFSPFHRYFRSKRMQLMKQTMHLDPEQMILDVGGAHRYWEGMECQNKVTCLNIRIPKLAEELPQQFKYVQADARYLPFGDFMFDIVFSNSVIEHLHHFEDQKQFAAEIKRVGKSYWVQTPNRRFPIEPHYVGLFIHYLPKRIQRHLVRWFTIWGLFVRPSKDQINSLVAEVRLMTEREMRMLFPDAQIHAERFFGLKKSFVAIMSDITG